MHTGLSVDAGGSGTTLMPHDAYRYARGDQITTNTGQPLKIRVPFDFYMVTDHSDMLGAIIDIKKGAPNIMSDPDGSAVEAAGTRLHVAHLVHARELECLCNA